MMTNSDEPRQFPHVSKARRMLALAMVAPAVVIAVATVVAFRMRKPLPDTPVGWGIEFIVDSVLLANLYLTWQFGVWAVVYTPEAEKRLIKRLSQFAFWGIVLVLMTVVMLLVFT